VRLLQVLLFSVQVFNPLIYLGCVHGLVSSNVGGGGSGTGARTKSL
jgi:hypothetical protein